MRKNIIEMLDLCKNEYRNHFNKKIKNTKNLRCVKFWYKITLNKTDNTELYGKLIKKVSMLLTVLWKRNNQKQVIISIQK